MNCIKCGQEITGNQVFCEECLADMELHPVKQGTPVILPPREKQIMPKHTHHRRARKPEEIIALLRSAVLWLSILLIVLTVALTLTVSMLLKVIDRQDLPLLPGQNYGTSASDLTETTGE